MSRIKSRIHDLGLTLPEALKLPPGVRLPFSQVNVRGQRAFISGHGPQNPDGSLSGPFGKLGDTVSLDEGYQLARLTGLSILASLERELGNLDRITGWGKLFGMVNSTPDFTDQPLVINGCSDLILEIFGPDIGRHARSAVGMAALPFGEGIAVEIEGEVLID